MSSVEDGGADGDTVQTSWSPGLLARHRRSKVGIVGAGVPPARRVGLAPPSELQRLVSRIRETVGRAGNRVGLCVSDFPQHRPSDPPSAGQRRTIGVVARRMIDGLRPRRWCAGGLPRGLERCTETVYRGDCPVRHCAVDEGNRMDIDCTMSNPARPDECQKLPCSGAMARPDGSQRLEVSGVTPTACHLERVSPRTSRKVPTGLGARISRRTAS